MSEYLKAAAVSYAKTMLAQIPFNTVYSYADNLFDKAEMLFGDARIQTEINFLQTTNLGNIAFEDTDKSYFKIRNTETGDSITVSNREQSRGELRGEILRNHIEAAKLSDPDQSVYEMIDKAVKNPKYSDMVTMLRGSMTGENARMTYDGGSMSVESFNLFAMLLVNQVSEKIASKQLAANLEPKEIRSNPELQKKVWDGINAEGLYDASVQFEHHLQVLKEKADTLHAGGHFKASLAAHGLYDNLQIQKSDLMQGVIDAKDFSNNCTHLIEEAQNGELQKHPGFFGKLLHNLCKILNVVTFGAVEAKQAELMEKTREMKESLQNFTQAKSAEPVEPVAVETNDERSTASLGG